MQPFRIRSNDKITQGFTNAELDFAFYRSPPPGVSDICYPEFKLSTNEAQLVAFCLSSKTRPTHPKNSRFLGKWSLENVPHALLTKARVPPPLLRPHPAEVDVDKPFAFFGQIKEGSVRQGPRHYG